MRCALVLPVWAEILLNEMPRSGETSSAAQGSERGSDLRTCMVLLAHGSREPRWREPFERIYLQMRRDLGDDVRIAYMEFTGPTLFDVAEECSKVDVRKMRILPLFMAAGAHLVTDVPEQAQQLRELYPRMEIEILPPIGEDSRMILLVQQIIRDRAA